MVDEGERERRKQFLRAVKAEEMLRADQELPASKQILESLFNWLDEKLGDAECNDTLRFTVEFARSRGLTRRVFAGGPRSTAGIVTVKC